MKTDPKGLQYVQIKMVRQTKNHRGDDLRDVDDKDGRMYEIPGHVNCPVKAFTKYFSRLHPDCNDFWQRPKRADRVTESDNVWYDNVAVGKNTLGNIMANLSNDCGLSKRYTNHCVRSTCITVLDNGGKETRHIIYLSGHKSETSVKSYCNRLSDTKKREMSEILSENVTRKVDNSGTKNADVDLLSDDVDFDAILQDITNFEGNMGQ